MMDAERLEIMDAQRFDASKRRTVASRLNLSIQTGLSHDSDSDDASVSFESHSPLDSPVGSWDSLVFAQGSSPEASDSASDSLESTPPTSLNSSITLEDDVNPQAIRQTDVFDKGPFVTTRTIIRPMPRSPLLPGCFSRPSSPVNVTSRPSSPINFAALNCFSTDAFTQEVNHLQAQRARELEGTAEMQVRVHKVVSTEAESPWIVQRVAQPEGLRRRAMEPRGFISSP
ncbi:hypothetical protein FB451DRAFT_199626 [Mycena latifolia]|nr:hypothetical protein FB451DRAFT_199626 [Mycena latifolia]